MEQTGRCLCGAVTYRTSGEPVRVGLCHCAMCRKSTGSAYAAVAVFEPGQVAVQGETARFTARRWERRFCPGCGTQLFVASEADGILDVMLGTLDDPGAFVPTYEIHCAAALPWTPRDPAWLCYAGERDGPARRGEV